MTLAASGWWDQHGIHALTLLAPILAVTVLAAGADVRAWLRRRDRKVQPAILVAGVLSLPAAVVHLAVCPEHFGEAALYGVFFAVVAVAQVVWPWLAVVRPQRWVLAAGLVGNLAIFMLWAVTRTIGIPLGPESGEVEAVGLLDVVSAVLELGVVVACAWALLEHRLTQTAAATSELSHHDTAPSADGHVVQAGTTASGALLGGGA
jgi:hypothetical protein